jgi:hypothetical protein
MNGKSVTARASRESSSSLTLSPSVSPSSNVRPPLVNSLFGAFVPFLAPQNPDPYTNRWAGVVGGVFVCASWALRATDRVITVVAGPDDSDSIAPMADSARIGGIRSKWTGTALRARSSNGSGGSPYSSTYSGSSYAGSPVGSPILPYSPYSPVAPPPLSSRTLPTTAFAVPGSSSGLGLSNSVFGPGPPGTTRTPTTAATVGSSVPGQGTSAYGHFPPTPRSPLSGFAALPTVKDAEKDD